MSSMYPMNRFEWADATSVEVKLLVGRWGCDDIIPDGRGDAIKNTDGTDRTLAESRKRLAELYPLLTTGRENTDPGNKKQLVGTAGA